MKKAFDYLFETWNLIAEHDEMFSKTPYEEDVSDFIYKGKINDEGWISWKPIEKTKETDASPLQELIESEIHNDFKEYLNSYWFMSLDGFYNNEYLWLFPIKPNKEMKDILFYTKAYKEDHPQDILYIPIGLMNDYETILFHNETGLISKRDIETGNITELNITLNELIVNFKFFRE